MGRSRPLTFPEESLCFLGLLARLLTLNVVQEDEESSATGRDESGQRPEATVLPTRIGGFFDWTARSEHRTPPISGLRRYDEFCIARPVPKETSR